MNSSEIRQAFFDYFVQQGHTQVASSSLVPLDDPTLLFTNAGMVQFKDVFLGRESRPYSRAVSAQRCVRAGGKHNDLDNVGYTARHHTFFEMLGNFSFGDYFKRDAITYAWEFLTQVLKLPTDKLWITVFEEDDEAADIWLKDVGVSPDRFSRCGADDNFWSMGDTGPCGPCTEIFYDHGPEIAGGPPGTPTADGDRYIEIWNLVFMQFNRDKDGQLHPLPKPSVDTGMGLERITAVVQGVHNNYEIDSFQYLIKAIGNLAPHIDLAHPSCKVVADHIRACAFLIADGVLPTHDGRGYVLRRIIRRAVRHGHQLGLPVSFFTKLVQPLCVVMGEAYPELRVHQAHIERVLSQEEQQFSRTLEQGLRLLTEYMSGLSGHTIHGDMAFKLYDTYGFPVDLTADMAREHGFSVDMDGFHACMQQQRLQSQSASQFQADYASLPQLDGIVSIFEGYDQNVLTSQVVMILQDGHSVERIGDGVRAQVILQSTPFYPESGGQVGDRGMLIDGDCVFRVEDTQYQGQAIVHHGQLLQGELRVKQTIYAEIDTTRRGAIRLNHTATHLLHAALKHVLGTHVNQRGSRVDADSARFDFSHGEALTTHQIEQLEQLVNAEIRRNTPVTTTIMSLDDASKSGAVALFGEKYADDVRVLSIGDFSKELCGGTHASHLGDLGLFKILSEYGVASGVRRIEWVTGSAAILWLQQQSRQIIDIASLLKSSSTNIVEKLTQSLMDAKTCEKEVASLKQQLAVSNSHALLAEVQTIGDINLLVKRLDELDAHGLRSMLDQLKSTLQNSVIVLCSVSENKISVVAGVSKSIIGRVPNAATWVRHLCGKGGGRDDMAQGGGTLPDDLSARLSKISEMITEHC
jgi:alanyl-tRNA synthetase